MKKIYKGEEISKKVIDFCLGKYKFIFIAGNGGSGKTTLSKQLVEEITSRDLNVNCIDMDDFMIDSRIRKSAQKEWVDSGDNKRIGYLGWTFEEAYHMAHLESIIHSLIRGKDPYYKPKNSSEFVELKSEFPITIIEGVGTAFLKKEEMTFGIFVTCDFKNEVDRRMARARDGETLRKEVEKKATERNQQYEMTIFPEKNKFDLELGSLEDYSFRLERDSLNVL